ncbi:hypothetical protein LQG66_36295 [Bradyrhizobium ontarionense]|uniref:Uncharacterized protein n=1 Tax=Bradyrhizobium ontarionense TaxID=2898149 RepID=A0ABY3RB33_9BRAD|nr:hypothetical protein [Bradyrhizobium sp. A19]UFZ04584.1 hypothetical protein LQG66_36295 [Bradyrhizobium sp. A19]
MYEIIDAILTIGCLAAVLAVDHHTGAVEPLAESAIGPHCGGPECHAWMIPIFLAAVGGPAINASSRCCGTAAATVRSRNSRRGAGLHDV